MLKRFLLSHALASSSTRTAAALHSTFFLPVLSQQLSFVSSASLFLIKRGSSSSSSSRHQHHHEQRQHDENETQRLSMLDSDQLARELDRYGRHTPNVAHTRRLLHELLARGPAANPRMVREALSVAHRCNLHGLAVELFLARVQCASDLERNMLGLPEDIVESAALIGSGGDDNERNSGGPLVVQKLLAVTRTVEPVLRKAPSVDVVAGIEFSLFRALWRCFVCLKKLRLSTPLEDRRAGDELDLTEAARRIFDLIRIVNTRVLISPPSSGPPRRLDESAAFRTVSRAVTLCVLYSESSDDGEAEFFRLVNSRRWLQADVSSSPSARYSSLIRTCYAGRRHDIATSYFEEFEAKCIFNLRRSVDGKEGASISSETNSPSSQRNKQQEILASLNSHLTRQLNFVLHAYWSLLNNCEVYGKVTSVLDRYLLTTTNHATSSSSSASLLSPSVIALAMRAVGETRESALAARAMASLLRSASASASSSSPPSTAALTASDEVSSHHSGAGDPSSGLANFSHAATIVPKRYSSPATVASSGGTSSSSSSSSSSASRPPSSYEMATCLLALAKCGHSSFHRALETCLQEQLIEESALRVAELNLQYALNDPVECLRIVQAEAARCNNLASGPIDILSDARCASLILQILLRADHPTYLSTLEKLAKKSAGSSSSDGVGVAVQAAWVDWLIIWAQRRRYELSNEQRQSILKFVALRSPSMQGLGLQAKLIERDLQQALSEETRKKKKQQPESKRATNTSAAGDDVVVHSDPRCNWAKRRTALQGLVLPLESATSSRGSSSDQENGGGSCVAESLGAHPLACSMQQLLRMQQGNSNACY